MLTAHDITYLHPNRELLFENISFSIQRHEKVALIGNNGVGKSTLLKIIAGILPPSFGVINSDLKPYYVPQHFGQYNDSTIANALQIEEKLKALHAILQGKVSDTNLKLLNDDWTIEERSLEAMSYWELKDFPLTRKMESLSGGEKTKVFLAGIMIHQPGLVLLDEPTNHLDLPGREALYNFIETTTNALVVVSHDKVLLDLLCPVYELDKKGITTYGGNYSFYREQREIADRAIYQEINEQEKELRKAKKAERETIERKQRQDVRGKGKHVKEGVARIFMKTLKNSAEASSARLKEVHTGKIESITQELKQAQQKLQDTKKMQMNFEKSSMHTGKTLINTKDLNFSYKNKMLWEQPLNIHISSGERICFEGKNGSGKTTLIKIILGEIQPVSGTIFRSSFNSIYIDQDYSLILDGLTVYEQAEQYNKDRLPEHEVKIRLNRFLFHKDSWDKNCNTLSGGEKMRLMLCCLMISNHTPDLFVLDEPTNNLDIRSTEILTAAVKEYNGTLLVISHDSVFLEEINVNRKVELL